MQMMPPQPGIIEIPADAISLPPIGIRRTCFRERLKALPLPNVGTSAEVTNDVVDLDFMITSQLWKR